MTPRLNDNATSSDWRHWSAHIKAYAKIHGVEKYCDSKTTLDPLPQLQGAHTSADCKSSGTARRQYVAKLVPYYEKRLAIVKVIAEIYRTVDPKFHGPVTQMDWPGPVLQYLRHRFSPESPFSAVFHKRVWEEYSKLRNRPTGDAAKWADRWLALGDKMGRIPGPGKLSDSQLAEKFARAVIAAHPGFMQRVQERRCTLAGIVGLFKRYLLERAEYRDGMIKFAPSVVGVFGKRRGA
jgi:hypothetical protein